MTNPPCPCQNGSSYEQCCQPLHKGQQYAPTAETLMRSRYSAYALGETDYLIATTHRENPQYQKDVKRWREILDSYCRNTQFLKLLIVKNEPGETESSVTFEATLSQNGQSFILAEKSRFLKIGQRWLYHSGVTTTKTADPA